MFRVLIRTCLLAGLAAFLLLPAAGAGPSAREGVVRGQLVELHKDVIGDEPIPGFGLDTGPRTRVLDDAQPRELVGQEVAVEDGSSLAGLQGEAEETSGTRQLLASGGGARTTAVVLVNFTNDTSTPVTPAQLTSRVFTGSDSVREFYEQQSGDAVTLTGIVNPAGDVFGWWTLPIAKTTTCSDSSMMSLRTSLRTYATGQGVNLDAYDHVVIYFAQNNACGWAGLGELPGEWSWINGYNNTSVIAHEIGHNMGAHHAASLSCGSSTLTATGSGCTYTEYGDGYDVMGSSSALMSIWHRSKLGQLPSAARSTVTTSGSYTIDNANDSAADDPRVLLVPRQIGSAPVSEYFAIELRSQFGSFDTFSPSAPQVTGVTIRLVPLISVVDVSQLLDAHPGTGGFTDSPLQPGETFTDPGSGVSITNSETASGSATVAVSIDAGDTAPPSVPVLTAGASGGSVSLSWSAATDDVGVDHYELRRDGVAIATTPAGVRSYTDTPPASAASAVYRVVAFDAAGNSAQSAPLGVSLPDVTAPQLALASATRLADGRVQFALAATDNRAVSGYRIEWIGGSATVAGPVWIQDPAPAAATSYVVRALDAAGNQSAAVTISVGAAPAGSSPAPTTTTTVPPRTDAPLDRPRVVVTRGRGGRIVVTVRGATRIAVRTRGWAKVARGSRLTGTLPARVRSARAAKLQVHATVDGARVSASVTLRRSG